MSYINSVSVGGSTYNLRDEEAIHDVSALATKEELTAKADRNELNNYATKGELTNVNMSVEGTTLILTVSSGGPGGSGNEEIMAEFAVSSTTTNSEGHTVVALEGLTNLYNDEQRRQELQNNTFSFKWVDSNGTDRGQNGQFQLANSATEEFPAGPGNEKMVINWTAGTLTFINTGASLFKNRINICTSFI